MDPAHGRRALRERVGIVLQQCGVQNDLTVEGLIEMYETTFPRRCRSSTPATGRRPCGSPRRTVGCSFTPWAR